MQLRLYQKLRSSKGLVFCKPCNNVLDPRKLENVTVGSLVEINTTPSSRTANFVKGRVKKRSTEQDYCPTGIPVELEEGGKGNTERIIEFVPSKIDPEVCLRTDPPKSSKKHQHCSKMTPQRDPKIH